MHVLGSTRRCGQPAPPILLCARPLPTVDGRDRHAEEVARLPFEAPVQPAAPCRQRADQQDLVRVEAAEDVTQSLKRVIDPDCSLGIDAGLALDVRIRDDHQPVDVASIRTEYAVIVRKTRGATDLPPIRPQLRGR
jgi:hypothetical protein